MPTSLPEDVNIPEMGIMELPERLDGDTAIQTEENILLCIQGGTREMLLDCSTVNYITGTGIQTLLRLAREMQAVNGKFAVCNLQPQVKDMFDVCGLESIIPIYPDREAARSAMAA